MVIEIFVTRNFDNLIRFVFDEYELYERGLNPSWRVVVLDYDEWKSFIDDRTHFNNYKEEFFGKADIVKEYDYEIDTLNAIGHCCPSSANKENIEMLNEELDQNRLEKFNFETKFIQRLFNSYDVDHLILINDESFSMLLNVQRPEILTHEAFHIVEYELYDQTHIYEEVQENAENLAEQYIASLTDEQRKREFKKICSHRKGRGIYGRLRIITKFR